MFQIKGNPRQTPIPTFSPPNSIGMTCFALVLCLKPEGVVSVKKASPAKRKDFDKVKSPIELSKQSRNMQTPYLSLLLLAAVPEIFSIDHRNSFRVQRYVFIFLAMAFIPVRILRDMSLSKTRVMGCMHHNRF